MLNHKVIELIIDLIDNLKGRVMKNRRVDASRLSRPHLLAPTLTFYQCKVRKCYKAYRAP